MRLLRYLCSSIALIGSCAVASDRPPIYGDDFQHLLTAASKQAVEWKHDRPSQRSTFWAVRPEDDQHKLAKQLVSEFRKMSEEGSFVVFTTGGAREVKLDVMLSVFAKSIDDVDCSRLGILIVAPASVEMSVSQALTTRGVQIVTTE